MNTGSMDDQDWATNTTRRVLINELGVLTVRVECGPHHSLRRHFIIPAKAAIDAWLRLRWETLISCMEPRSILLVSQTDMNGCKTDIAWADLSQSEDSTTTFGYSVLGAPL